VELTIAGVHHFKLPVSDLERSLAFYTKLLHATPIPALEHKHKSTGQIYAHICEVPGLGTKLELRLNPEQAAKQRKWDPVTIAVTDRAMLRLWSTRLDQLGIAHSGEIVAVQAWLVTFDDPDGNRLRFYTLETHGPELPPDEGNEWLKN
jgi:catechol 2,3-dioxygenase-like lactoylglutathione lyase family enzyme